MTDQPCIERTPCVPTADAQVARKRSRGGYLLDIEVAMGCRVGE